MGGRELPLTDKSATMLLIRGLSHHRVHRVNRHWHSRRVGWLALSKSISRNSITLLANELIKGLIVPNHTKVRSCPLFNLAKPLTQVSHLGTQGEINIALAGDLSSKSTYFLFSS